MEGKEDYITYIDNNNEDNICSICIDKINIEDDDIFRLECDHVFHKKCISEWVIQNEYHIITCPLCRKDHNKTVKNNNIHNIQDKYDINNIIIVTNNISTSTDNTNDDNNSLKRIFMCILYIIQWVLILLMSLLIISAFSGILLKIWNIRKE